MSQSDFTNPGKRAILPIAKVARTATIRNQASGFFMPKNISTTFDAKARWEGFESKAGDRWRCDVAVRQPSHLAFAFLKGHKMYTIYGLIDPRTYAICCVGMTQNHPEVRLQEHLKKGEEASTKGQWITELRKAGLKPSTVILDFAYDIDNAQRKEAWWINHGILIGWKLTNDIAMRGRKKTPDEESAAKQSVLQRITKKLLSNEEVARLWLAQYADSDLPRGWSTHLAQAIAVHNNDLPNWETAYKSEAARWKERYHPSGKEYATYQPADGWPKPHGWPRPEEGKQQTDGREIVDLDTEAGQDEIRRIDWRRVEVK